MEYCSNDPFDDAIRQDELNGAAPINSASNSPAVCAIRELATILVATDRDSPRQAPPDAAD